ncbi:MAG: sulfite exporter TauE/SafE family protein [Actinomycetota bacterium]|nr:sulfite exporter TauE/SafE family protein [Actinomycetota bacterium]
MDESVWRDWLTPLAAGLAGGFLAGLFGVGGGVLLVPLLVLVLGRSQHVAHATSLLAITIPALAGTLRFAAEGAVAWGPAALVAVGALAGVQLGAALLPRVSERRLQLLFALLLAIMSLRLVVFGAGVDSTGPPGDETFQLAAGALVLHTVLGLVSGTAAALLGIGGGAIVVPVLVIGFGYGQHLAEGTSLAVIVPTALVGAATHGRRSYTDWPVGLRLGAGGLVGSLVGAELALALPGTWLSRAFGLLLAVVTTVLVRRALRERPKRDEAAGRRDSRPDPPKRVAS